MTELEKSGFSLQGEVISELDYCALQIREHHSRFSRSLRTTLEEARQIGDYLNLAQSKFSRGQISRGDFKAWFEENCGDFMSRDSAGSYQRIARRWEELGVRNDHGPLGIRQALKMLAATKDEGQQGESGEPQLPVDPEKEPEVVDVPPEPTVTLPDGRQVGLVEAEQILSHRATPPKVKIGRKEFSEEEIKEEFKSLANKQREAEEKRKQLESALKQREAKWARDYADELAKLRLKYGVKESPSIMEIPEDIMAEALANAPSKRLEDASTVVLEITRFVGSGILEFSPEESVRATMEVLPSPSPEHVLRDVGEILDWLNQFNALLTEQTTPGVRAVR